MQTAESEEEMLSSISAFFIFFEYLSSNSQYRPLCKVFAAHKRQADAVTF